MTNQRPATRERAKPLLGTFVEIRVDCGDEASFIAATDAAFARIENIHRAMSFHEPTSDLQAIARCSGGEYVCVDPDTLHVLQLALQLESDSDGIFNPTIARTQVRNGLLPRPIGAACTPKQSTLAKSIRVEKPSAIHVLQPVWIDLGGIAKGYAVDAATQALMDHGVRSGVVNAGGDLRVFGQTEQQIYLRHPSNPSERIPIANLQELSCATSGNYFVANHICSPGSTDSQQTTILGARAPCAERYASLSVIAPRCEVADALTKVLWIAGIGGAISRVLLAKYEAQAVVLGVNGGAIYA